MSVKYPSWQEATAGGLWLLGAAGLTWLGPQLPLLECVILWMILSVGLLIILRRFWSWLLGPLFFYDLVRTARRNRLIPVRCLFAIALLAVVFLFYVNWFGLRGDSWGELFLAPSVRREDLASFGSSMFSLFFGMQYLAVFLLTPIYTAGAIAEEKERRTLDLLLTTELTNREIVLGLLASRLSTLGLIFLTVVPTLSLLEFLGGIDPQLVLIGFFIIGMAIVSVGCMSLLVSIYARSMTRALLESYAYMLAFGACVIGIPITISQKAYDLTAVFVLTETFGFITGSLSVIHVLFAVVRLRKANQGSTPWPVRPLGFPSYDELPQDFREIFPLHESASGIDWPIDRPRVSDSPVFWKEVTSWNISSLLALNLVCFIGFVFLLCLGLDFSARLSDQNEFIKNASPWGVAILSFFLGIMSSRMIAKERQKRTLDALVLTCLDAKEILAGKRNACITRIYWSFIFGMIVLALAVLNDAIYVAAFFCFILAAVVYIAFFACVGLFISTWCATSLRAMFIFTVVFLCLGLGGFAYLDPLYLSPGLSSWGERVLFYIISPMSALQELTFNERRALDNTKDITAALAAVGVLALATWFLWNWTVFCFERSTGSRWPSPRRSSFA